MKPTIASLQKELAASAATVTDLRLRLNTSQGQREEEQTRRYNAERETKSVREELERGIAAERRARENAESIYDQHRSAVLHYFMAASNPETAKDAKRLVVLQQIVCGLVPVRNCVQEKKPWEL